MSLRNIYRLNQTIFIQSSLLYILPIMEMTYTSTNRLTPKNTGRVRKEKMRIKK